MAERKKAGSRKPRFSVENALVRRKLLTETPYVDNGVVDPFGISLVRQEHMIGTAKQHIFVARHPAIKDKHYVVDIESFGLDPRAAHQICTLNVFDFNEKYVNHPHLTIERKADLRGVWADFVVTLERDIVAKQQTSCSVALWAHNGARFDWKGLADYLNLSMINPSCARQYDTEIERHFFSYTLKIKGSKEWIELRATTRDLIPGKRGGVSLGNIKRVVKLRFYDSFWLLSAPLKDLGVGDIQKLSTPKKYTDPLGWLESNKQDLQGWYDSFSEEDETYCMQDLYVLANAMKELQSSIRSITNGAVDALSYMTAAKYSQAVMLSFQKTNQLQLPPNKFITLENVGGNITPVMLDIRNDKFLSKEDADQYLFTTEEKTNRAGVKERYIIGNTPALVPAEEKYPVITQAIYLDGIYAKRLKDIQVGGRTEVFLPVTPEGYILNSIDAASQYPTVMIQDRFTDPTKFKQRLVERDDAGNIVNKDLRGRQEILEYLKKYGGYVRVTMKPPVSQDFYKLPLFPFRISGGEADERLIFPAIVEKTTFNTHSLLLEYLLNHSEIEDDDIVVHGADSFFAPYYSANDARLSFKQAITKLFYLRQEAKFLSNAGESLSSKITMNSASGGTIECHDFTYHIKTDSSPESISVASNIIEECKLINPGWSSWDSFETMIQAASDPKERSALLYDTLNHFFDDNFFKRSPYYIDVQQDDGSVVRDSYMQYSLPDMLAPAAIRSFGVEIVLHAQRRLHETAMKLMKAGYLIQYFDTDSVKFCTQHECSPEEFEKIGIQVKKKRSLRELSKLGIHPERIIAKRKRGEISQDEPIDFGLPGDWELEGVKVDTAIMPDDADVDVVEDLRTGKTKLIPKRPRGVFLGPKNYHIIVKSRDGKRDCVISSTIKGIPSAVPAMRSAMFGFMIQNSRLGDKFGLHFDNFASRDAGDIFERHIRELALAGSEKRLARIDDLMKSKRNFNAGVNAMSNPIELRQPDLSGVKSWQDYILKFKVNGASDDLIEAYKFYQNCHIKSYNNPLLKSISVFGERKRLKELFHSIQAEMFSKKERNEEYDLDNLLHEMQKRYFMQESLDDAE